MNTTKSTTDNSVQKPSTPESNSYGTATGLVEGGLTVMDFPLTPKTHQFLRKDACKIYHVDFETFVMVVNIEKTGLTLMLQTKPCSLELDALMSSAGLKKIAKDTDSPGTADTTSNSLYKPLEKKIATRLKPKLTGKTKTAPKTSKKTGTTNSQDPEKRA